MTDALATKQDLRELEMRMEVRFTRIDIRTDGLERHIVAEHDGPICCAKPRS